MIAFDFEDGSQYVITANRYCWMVAIPQTDKKTGKVIPQGHSYHTTFPLALRALFDMKVRKSEFSSFGELLANMESIRDEVVRSVALLGSEEKKLFSELMETSGEDVLSREFA